MNLMADASSREDIWTKTMDFLNMPDWLKLEMVQSVGAKILHVAVWLVISWILLKLFCQVLREITVLKMSPQASRLTVKIVKNAGYIIIGVEAFALMGFDILTLLGAASIIGVAVGFASQTSLSNIISGLFLVGEKQINLGVTVSVKHEICPLIGRAGHLVIGCWQVETAAGYRTGFAGLRIISNRFDGSFLV